MIIRNSHRLADMEKNLVMLKGYRGLVCCICLLVAAPSCMTPVQPIWGAPETNEPKLTVPDDEAVFDIVRVNKFFEQYPWLSFDSGGVDRIDGFKCAVYLESSDGENKGVFGSGTIVVTMFRLETGPDGREVALPVYEWTLPSDKAYRFRAKEPTLLGWGYGLFLRWGKNVDVQGRKIAISIKYIREDGRVVRSSRKVLRVPISGDAWGTVSQRPRPNIRGRR